MFHNHFHRAVLQNQCLPYLEMQEYYIYLNGMININESQKTIICLLCLLQYFKESKKT